MKLKEYLALIGIKSNYKFFPQVLKTIGQWNGFDVQFYIWKTPKNRPYSLDLTEIEELQTFLKDGDVAIDVGAHMGDSTLPIALACGSTGKVFAFEPNPVVFQILAKNSFLNVETTNIVPLPFACTDDEVVTKFWYSSPWLANGGDRSDAGWRYGASYPVHINGKNPLGLLETKFSDDIQRLKYIKIDVEGFDIHVLRQFQTLIDKVRPYIKFEVFGKTTLVNRKALFDFVLERNYQLYLVGDSGKLFAQNANEEDFYKKTSVDIFCVPKEGHV